MSLALIPEMPEEVVSIRIAILFEEISWS
jgi:hypothetical protein